MRALSRSALVAVLVAVLGGIIALTSFAPAANALTTDWDRKANISEAAQRLSKLHRAKGSKAVLNFLDACYRTHMLASTFNAGLEGCMAQDYMHSQVLALIYARVPEETRKKLRAPSPQIIAASMSSRFAKAFAQYKFNEADATELKGLVDKHGFPIFLKAVFPKAGKRGEAPDAPQSDAPKSDAPADVAPDGAAK
ncbi:MAG: hypothetical protein ACRCS9_01835 [Hyphomicrobium sp.]